MKTTQHTATTWGQLILDRRKSGAHLPDGSTRQVDFADLCGVTQATISAWENGESIPSRRAQQTLVNRLEITPLELWTISQAVAA